MVSEHELFRLVIQQVVLGFKEAVVSHGEQRGIRQDTWDWCRARGGSLQQGKGERVKAPGDSHFCHGPLQSPGTGDHP